MKTKKSSLSLILALVMVLAMTCGAWAATAVVEANGVSVTSTDKAYDITAQPGVRNYGLWAHDGGSIFFTGGTISTEGNRSMGVYANLIGKVEGSGTVITSGDNATGVYALYSSDITWSGNITTYEIESRGGIAQEGSSLDLTGDIVTYGYGARGFSVAQQSYGIIRGNITTYGELAFGVSSASMGSVLILTGNVITSGEGAMGVVADANAALRVTGNVTTTGENAHGVRAQRNASVTMAGGTVEVADTGSSYSFNAGSNGTINLENVTAEGQNLLLIGNEDMSFAAESSGTFNVSNGSVLAGDVLHVGTTTDTAVVNLTDSVWNGAAEASGDIGAIDINLENSQWNVTGDTNTNGKVTADEGSKVDFNGTTDNITVIIDSLAGDPDLTVKPGDKLIIKNPAGSVESSNPDVIEVVTNDDGSIEIIFKGDGEAELKYQYIDEDGKIQTGVVNVVSGAGSIQTSTGGGGSSNCNTGVGAAVFALFGLALIQKRK